MRGEINGCRMPRLPRPCMFVAMLLAITSAHLAAAPLGGQITAGSGAINATGANTVIQQNGGRLVVQWTSFSTNSGESVTFNQPGASAIALNRVTGTSPSILLGGLNANGQVFIVNPAGVIFGRGAKVSVGGLIASTLGLSDQDFMAGRYAFANRLTAGPVVNLGAISAAPGGYVALIAPRVFNVGSLVAPNGVAALGAGNRVTVTLSDHAILGLSVDRGALRALASNGGLIQTDGGQAWLTAGSEGALLSGVVNNTGVIRAQSAVNQNGVIRLVADGGTTVVGGTLDASASSGNAGGVIDTEGARVRIRSNANVSTQSANGGAGNWSISAGNFTVAPRTGRIRANVTGATLSRLLESNNIAINTTSTQTGNIAINDALAWQHANTFALNASNGIGINNTIDAPAGIVALSAGTVANQSAPLIAAGLALTGANGQYRLDQASNRIGMMSARARSVDLVDQAPLSIGTVSSVSGVTTGDTITVSAPSITLDAPVRGNATGTAVTLASASNFVNNAGAQAVSTPNGRWLIYSNSPDGDTFGGLQSNELALWGDTYLRSSDPRATVATGNRFGFSALQQVTLSANAIDKPLATSRVLGPGDVAVHLRYVGSNYGNAFADSPTVHEPFVFTLTSVGLNSNAAIGSYVLTVTTSGAQPIGYSVSTLSGTVRVVAATPTAPIIVPPPSNLAPLTPVTPSATNVPSTPQEALALVSGLQTVAAETGNELGRAGTQSTSLQRGGVVEISSQQNNRLSADAWPGNVCRK